MNTIYLILTLWTAFAGKDSRSISITPPPCSPDYETLKAFYLATDGPHWIHTWDINDCTVTGWHGVEKDRYGRVISLGLPSNNLSGIIPDVISQLSYLQNIQMAGNHLNGIIPENLSSLTNLQYLTLENNQLQGNISASLGLLPNLITLNLSQNQLNGNIPNQLGSLSNLKHLVLNNNLLNGSIPAQLGSLSNLKNIYLNSNQLSGCFPDNLRHLCNQLTYYDFIHNPSLPGGGDFASFCSSQSGSGSITWYLDADHDDHAISDTISCNSPGTGYTTTRLPIDDCNDDNASIHPGAPDYTCDGIDDDCDGLLDEDFTPMTCLICLHGMMSNNSPENATFTIIQPTCANPTGTITITNKAPLDSVSFDNGITYQLSSTKLNLTPGNYLILIKNIYGCSSLESAFARVLTACVPVCINGLDSVYYNDDTHIVTPIGSPSGGFFKVDNAPLAGDYWLQHLSLGMHTVSYSIIIPPYTTVVSRQIRIRQ